MLRQCVSKTLRTRQGQFNTLLHAQQRRDYNCLVIGGGITGLTAAWQAVQDPNCERLLIVEKSNRLGGWIDSETIPVEGGNVVFEYGPRTLKSSLPGSLPLLYLATNLGLYNDLIITPKSSSAAQNRYIYYPDRLVRMPAPKSSLSFGDNLQNILETLKEPLFDRFTTGILKDIFTPPRHPTEWAQDESVADFIGRRFGPKVADNLVSALFHGIYAGDIDRLSAQMLLGSARNLEGGVGGIGGFVSGGVTAGLLSQAMSRKKIRNMDDFLAVDAISAGPELLRHQHDLENLAAKASTFTFKRGVGQLVEALVASLSASEKVEIMLNRTVQGVRPDESRHTTKVLVGTAEKHHWIGVNHVISTIPPAALSKVIKKPAIPPPAQASTDFTPLLLEKQNYAVTTMVVNLYYPNPDLLPVEDGFGYLIPRSIPYEQNPECGLGVIFASCSSVGHGADPSSPTLHQDSAPGTKLTIMMGGHYWDGFEGMYPDHDTAVKMARDMLKRHLNITDTPRLARTRLQKDAIPQYTVGHLDRMYRLSKAVREEFGGSLVLAGNWYNGVGVGDCVKQGILSATYGFGKRINGTPDPWRPWTEHGWRDWDLRGGIAMSPVRLVESDI